MTLKFCPKSQNEKLDDKYFKAKKVSKLQSNLHLFICWPFSKKEVINALDPSLLLFYRFTALSEIM